MHIICISVVTVICWFVNIITQQFTTIKHIYAFDIQISWVTLAYSLFYSHFHLIFIFISILLTFFISYSTNNSIVLAIAISTDTYSPFICNITILYAVCSVNWVRDEQVRFIALQITLYVSSEIALKFFFYSSHLLFTFYVS